MASSLKPRPLAANALGRAQGIGHADMRASNMSVIARCLYEQGPMSRAALVGAVGVSKASVSSLVSELVSRGLVSEGSAERDGRVGRPGTDVFLSASRACGIGLEINVGYTAVVCVDLAGEVRFSVSHALPAGTPAAGVIIEKVCAQIREAMAFAAGAGMWVAGVTIAPPGVIDYERGIVRFAPNLGWRDVPLTQLVRDELGMPDLRIELENDAKLAAIAAYSSEEVRGAEDLVFLTGDVGVGAGILSSGRVMRGVSGYSGEIGHLTVDSSGPRCRCGRDGCFELYVGLDAFLAAFDEDHPAHNTALGMSERMRAARHSVDEGDEAPRAALEGIAKQLGKGVSVVTDILNPEAVVLGGYYGYFGDILAPKVEEILREREIQSGIAPFVVAASRGLESAAIGGALMAVDWVLSDPTIVPVEGE